MLAALLQTVVGLDVRAAMHRARRAVIVAVLCGTAVLLGFGFLLAALYIFLAERYGRLEAALGIGIGFVVLAVIVLIVDRVVTRVRVKRRIKEERTDQMKSLATAAALAALPTLIRSGGLFGAIVIPAAAALGYAIYKENARDAARPPRDDFR